MKILSNESKIQNDVSVKENKRQVRVLPKSLEHDTFTLKNANPKSKNPLAVKIMAGVTALSLFSGFIADKTLSANKSEEKTEIIEENKKTNDSKNKFIDFINNISSYAEAASVIPDNTFQGAFAGKEDYCEQLCNDYEVEPKFAAAIIGTETCWGSAGVADNNNPFSYRAPGDLGSDGYGFGIFSTPESGLEAGIGNLARYKADYGVGAIDIEHVDEIGQIYCGEDYTNWVNLVRDCYNSL